jgi:hypothetical protein
MTWSLPVQVFACNHPMQAFRRNQNLACCLRLEDQCSMFNAPFLPQPVPGLNKKKPAHDEPSLENEPVEFL